MSPTDGDAGRHRRHPMVYQPFRPEEASGATTSSTWRSFSTGLDPPCLKTQAPPFLQVISLQRGPSAQHGVPLLGTPATDILVKLPTPGNSLFDVTWVVVRIGKGLRSDVAASNAGRYHPQFTPRASSARAEHNMDHARPKGDRRRKNAVPDEQLNLPLFEPLVDHGLQQIHVRPWVATAGPRTKKRCRRSCSPRQKVGTRSMGSLALR